MIMSSAECASLSVCRLVGCLRRLSQVPDLIRLGETCACERAHHRQVWIASHDNLDRIAVTAPMLLLGSNPHTT